MLEGGRGWELRFQWLEEGLKGGVEAHRSFVSGALKVFHYPKTSLTKEVGIVQGDLLVSHGRQSGRQWVTKAIRSGERSDVLIKERCFEARFLGKRGVRVTREVKREKRKERTKSGG